MRDEPAVVRCAHGGEVAELVGAAGGPGDEVVHLEAGPHPAAREAALPVAGEDRPGPPGGEGAHGAGHPDRRALVVDDDRLDHAVDPKLLERLVGQHHAPGDLGGTGRRHVHHDLGPNALGDGVGRTLGPLHQRHQRVGGPPLPALPRLAPTGPLPFDQLVDDALERRALEVGEGEPAPEHARGPVPPGPQLAGVEPAPRLVHRGGALRPDHPLQVDGRAARGARRPFGIGGGIGQARGGRQLLGREESVATGGGDAGQLVERPGDLHRLVHVADPDAVLGRDRVGEGATLVEDAGDGEPAQVPPSLLPHRLRPRRPEPLEGVGAEVVELFVPVEHMFVS